MRLPGSRPLGTHPPPARQPAQACRAPARRWWSTWPRRVGQRPASSTAHALASPLAQLPCLPCHRLTAGWATPAPVLPFSSFSAGRRGLLLPGAHHGRQGEKREEDGPCMHACRPAGAARPARLSSRRVRPPDSHPLQPTGVPPGVQEFVASIVAKMHLTRDVSWRGWTACRRWPAARETGRLQGPARPVADLPPPRPGPVLLPAPAPAPAPFRACMQPFPEPGAKKEGQLAIEVKLDEIYEGERRAVELGGHA